MHRSYSQMNQLRTCGEQFRLQRIEHKPSRPSCAAVAGKAFHSLSEEIDLSFHLGVELADIQETVLADIPSEVENFILADESEEFPRDSWKRYGRRTEAKPNAEDMGWFVAEGIPNMVNAYVDWRAAHPELTLAVIPGFGPAIEVPFQYYLGDQLVYGWIDRVFDSSECEGHFPFDLKSGVKPKTDEQLGLYGAALQAGLGWKPTYGYYVYGLKSGTAKMTPPLNIGHWTDEKLKLVYLPATQQIETGTFVPHPGDACFHCGVAEHCDFAQAVI